MTRDIGELPAHETGQRGCVPGQANAPSHLVGNVSIDDFGRAEPATVRIACRPNFFLPVLVLSGLFRRLFLEKLAAAHAAGRLAFFGPHAHLADEAAFAAFLMPLRKTRWFVYSKKPFAGPKAVLAYLSRYTHRVAISNRRLIAADESGVTFKVKDYRIKGPGRYTTMTLATSEFIRRFLLHVLPHGLHRIRHYGLFANGGRVDNIARVRALLVVPAPAAPVRAEPAGDAVHEPPASARPCPCCGGRMLIIETFERSGATPRYGRPPLSSGSTRHEDNRPLATPESCSSPSLRLHRR